ncbi:hypothetical protein [Rhabdochlamydiaceae symbiont of Dictyostelium giganteum]|uniref:hypothetical protein n=1 Tax=Rhabdochlamydiaceae symbiont of Dictyostelium giganteum TaxID=3342349 RepID=UPI00384D7105
MVKAVKARVILFPHLKKGRIPHLKPLFRRLKGIGEVQTLFEYFNALKPPFYGFFRKLTESQEGKGAKHLPRRVLEQKGNRKMVRVRGVSLLGTKDHKKGI